MISRSLDRQAHRWQWSALDGVLDAVQRARSARPTFPNGRRGALLIREPYTPASAAHPLRAEEALRAALRPGHDLAREELVRAFVREAALAEGMTVSVASLIADDTVQAWLALCTAGSGRERARILLSCSRGDVKTRILLRGHSRFSDIVASLAGRIRREAGISYATTGSTDGRSAFTAT